MIDPEVTDIPLGDENEAQFRKITYADGTSVFRVQIRCDDNYHCPTCECDSEHYVALSETQVQAMATLMREN